MFKTETHMHTREVSACSHKGAIDMIKLYKEAGYSTVFVSDHFQSNFLDVLGDIPWNEKMAIFLSGYYKAKHEGEKLGVNVLPAAEICFTDSNNHYLAYGITKEFLDAYPNLHKMSAGEFLPIARAAGIFIVHAHPYRDGSRSATPELVDAIEIYNSNPRHEDYSEFSKVLAEKYDLPVTAGSDAHRDEDVACSGIETEEEIKTASDFIRLVKERKINIVRGTVNDILSQ
ncbi:MAG: PHP domain-containing protein [Clostridia bacterium]|nr:PHP domain-containing protein [Clostridia bacterium]